MIQVSEGIKSGEDEIGVRRFCKCDAVRDWHGSRRKGSSRVCYHLLECFQNVDYHPRYGGRVPWQSMFPAPATGCASRSSFTKKVVAPKAPPCVIPDCR